MTEVPITIVEDIPFTEWLVESTGWDPTLIISLLIIAVILLIVSIPYALDIIVGIVSAIVCLAGVLYGLLLVVSGAFFIGAFVTIFMGYFLCVMIKMIICPVRNPLE